MKKTLFLFIALFTCALGLNAQDMYRVTADKLRVRETKDSKSKIIGFIPKNENVTVVDAGDSKFYRVKLKNGEGWVSKDFLEKTASSANPSTPPADAAPATGTPQPVTTNLDIYRVTADDLRVRSQANPNSKIVGYLPKNENVAVLDSSNTSFFKIKVNNGEGWVSKEFLVRVSPINKPVQSKSAVAVEVPKIDKDYSDIIFFALVALILGTILFFIFKYSGQNKFLIGFSTIIVLIVGYFCFVTFIKEKTVKGVFSSNADTQYQSFNFNTKDSVAVKDIYTDTTFTAKYVIEGDMIKLYDQQNMILLLIRDENTLIGEGFTRGTFTKR